MSETSHGDWCATCAGCGGLIQDQYILRVSPDLSWHAACLKCCECLTLLDENQTCFVRDGKPYCKKDYIRLYSARCSACQNIFTKNDFVMRAKTKMFHLECFRCSACTRHLVPGDEFALHSSGLLCREDHEMIDNKEDNNNLAIKSECQEDFRESLSEMGRDEEGYREDLSSIKSDSDTLRAESPDSSRGDSNRQERREDRESVVSRLGQEEEEEEVEDGLLPSLSPSSPPPARGRGRGPGKGRSNRGRTVLTEKQRTILTACFQHNPKPDALLKEQLVEMTGLNARVIRVWFQNRRCKEHKRVKAAVLITRKDHQKIGYGSMNGIPMVAGSPVRQESPMGVSGVDITGYHPPWQDLPEFSARSDQGHFNNLIGQMHGYDPRYSPAPPPSDLFPLPPPPGIPYSEAGFPAPPPPHSSRLSSPFPPGFPPDRDSPLYNGERGGVNGLYNERPELMGRLNGMRPDDFPPPPSGERLDGPPPPPPFHPGDLATHEELSSFPEPAAVKD